jgi:uncharacterized RDD family membrane protein YckC
MTMTTLRALGAALLLLLAAAGHADTAASAAADESSRPAEATEHMDWDDDPAWPDDHARHHRHGNDVVSIGHDAFLSKGQAAHSVVSVLGSSTNEGEASQVISVVGNTRTTGTVSRDAVAVLGSTFVDGSVEGNAIAIGGGIELGPHAEVGGKVISVLGSIRRDPAAIVHGGINSILGGDAGDMSWLQTWVHHCLFYLRPLAPVAGLGWAWALALGFLAFYACLALLFRTTVDECVQTFEAQPGKTLLAALIAMLLTPVLIAVLCITVIGIAVVPFAVVALFCAGLFGKAVMLAWLGGRITGRPATGPFSHPAVAVLVGGVLVTACYLVPVLGFLVYKLLGFLGFGVVIYSLILAARAHQAAKGPGGTAPSATTAAAGGTTFAAAAPNDSPAESAAPAASPAGTSVPPSGAPPRPTSIPPEVLSTLPRAGFCIRMAALLVDVVLTGFTLSVLNHVFHFHLMVLAAYGAIMWKMRGSTVGGLVFDLRVVRADGRPMEWETAIVRALGCFLSLAVAGLGFIWIAFDSANQAWHDKIAGTLVVRVPKGSSY